MGPGNAGGASSVLPMRSSLLLLRRLLRAVNARLRARYEADAAAAMGAVRGAARFRWLHELGGRGMLQRSGPLVYSYFARVPRGTSHTMLSIGADAL